MRRAALFAALLAAAAPGPAPARQPEVQRVVVIPVNLIGHRLVTVNRQQVAQALFGEADSVAAEYRTISYGALIFAGSVRDIAVPVTMPEPPDLCGNGLARLAAEAEAVATQRGVPVTAYNHVVFVVPRDLACGWTGIADIGGNRVWVRVPTAKALAHELGHNLGMDHAVTWDRSGTDGSDFMGSGTGGLNAPHVVQMGWLRDDPGKVIDITAAGDVTLEALETDPAQSPLPKVAIVHPAEGATTYYLSYRAASAADPLPDRFTQGVNIDVFDPRRRIGGLIYFVTALRDGQSYGDGPFTVRQIAHTVGAQVTVHIDFSGTGPAAEAGPPPAPRGTLQSLASGKCLDLPGGGSKDGTQPIQYDCHGGANQRWTIQPSGGSGNRIVSGLSGKCIGTDPDQTAPGAPVSQARCAGTSNQLWEIKDVLGGVALRNLATGLCLDIPGASTTNGAIPIVWTCNDGINQTWRYQAP